MGGGVGGEGGKGLLRGEGGAVVGRNEWQCVDGGGGVVDEDRRLPELGGLLAVVRERRVECGTDLVDNLLYRSLHIFQSAHVALLPQKIAPAVP